MRKFILFGLLAYASTAHAQNKSNLSVADLIESKRFVFVVNDVKKKPGLNGVSGLSSFIYHDKPNPSVMTVRQSYNVTILNWGKAVAQDYYRAAQSTGSYFEVYDIKDNKNSNTVNNNGENIYFTQNDNGIMVSESKDPNSITELKNVGSYFLSNNDYKLKSSEKANGSFTLKYTLKGAGEKQTFYIDVDQEGNAVLMQAPTKEFTTYLYGEIKQIPEKSI